MMNHAEAQIAQALGSEQQSGEPGGELAAADILPARSLAFSSDTCVDGH
jgi:hypothetical protein